MMCYTEFMAVAGKPTFSRRVVDHVMDELVSVLADGETYEFKTLFAKVYDGLKTKNAVSGGEEMLRLRSYEKLQYLANHGLVHKAGKTYRGLKGISEVSSAAQKPVKAVAKKPAASAG